MENLKSWTNYFKIKHVALSCLLIDKVHVSWNQYLTNSTTVCGRPKYRPFISHEKIKNRLRLHVPETDNVWIFTKGWLTDSPLGGLGGSVLTGVRFIIKLNSELFRKTRFILIAVSSRCPFRMQKPWCIKLFDIQT